MPAHVARAALRETFEETGLLIGDRAVAAASESPPDDPMALAYRAAGLVPALDQLRYVGRAITPPSSPMRFNTCFFHADGTQVIAAGTASGELDDLHWRALDAIDALKMAKVSRFMLERAAALHGGMASSAAPLYRWVRGAVRIGPDPYLLRSGVANGRPSSARRLSQGQGR
ncbi:MAG: hypothetical protein FJX35_05395 [Alphaproteobacteria bacterium]|nr:hypothetical protein [Alphaproteobacteria bacterium]